MSRRPRPAFSVIGLLVVLGILLLLAALLLLADQSRAGWKCRHHSCEFEHHALERGLKALGGTIDPQHAVDHDANAVGHPLDVASIARGDAFGPFARLRRGRLIAQAREFLGSLGSRRYAPRRWIEENASLPAALTRGVDEDGERLSARRVSELRRGKKNAWLEIVLDEGRNRQIRRLLAAHGIGVLRLVRVAIGPVALGTLAKGAFRALDAGEMAALAL